MTTLQLPEGYTVRKIGNQLKVVPMRKRKVAIVKKGKAMNYQVGQSVKIVGAIGGTVCATVTEVVSDKCIKATLMHTGGTYEYETEDLSPATEQDLADAKRWHERNVSMCNPEPLTPMEGYDYPWDMFDEDGVRIA